MQVNGFGAVEHRYVYSMAQELLNTYIDNTENGITTEGGLIDMQATMDEVPDNLRAGVFGTLLELLKSAGIEYDAETFQKRYTY